MARMETAWQRGNGDFDHLFPRMVDALRCEIDRVRGMEEELPIDFDVLREMQNEESRI